MAIRSLAGKPTVAAAPSSKAGARPVSMMVIHNSNPATPPTYRPAPPPPSAAPAPAIAVVTDEPVVVVVDDESKDVHLVNYDTVPK